MGRLRRQRRKRSASGEAYKALQFFPLKSSFSRRTGAWESKTNDETLRLLIVDDSKIVRERLITMLSELDGIEVVSQAQDVQEATSAIQQLKPELVILDIRIRGGSGIDVLENLKSGSPDSKVIVLTNYPYPQYREKCMSAGADFFFDKSTEFEEVMEVIKQLMSLSSRDINKGPQLQGLKK